MAVKVPTPTQSKKSVMRFLTLLFLSWFILITWAASLWCFLGFDKALHALVRLSQKQTQAITEFNSLVLAKKIKSLLGAIPTGNMNQTVVGAKSLITTGLNDLFLEEPNALTHITEDFFYISKKVWLLTKLTSRVMLIKMIILISAIPLFILSTTAGLVDGLNQRAIRTASLGRESSYVFHQINRYFKRGLLLLLILWLALPVSVTPALVFVPFSLILSIMVSITASRFKKYL